MEKERKKDTVTNYDNEEEDTLIYDKRRQNSFLNSEKGAFDIKSVSGINTQKSTFDTETIFNTRR